jgi:hypothetical protein
MGWFGNLIGKGLGSMAGAIGSKYIPISGVNGEDIGGKIGGALGNLMPFKKGGRVRKPRKPKAKGKSKSKRKK